MGGPSRSDLTFSVERQLFAQKEILCGQGVPGLEETAQESNEVQAEVVRGQACVRKIFA
jgi:hypothetical protein